MGLIFTALLGLSALILVTIPAIYYSLLYRAAENAVEYDGPVTYRQAGVIAVSGTIIWGAIHVFFGWIPVVGLLLPPIAWIGSLKHYTDSDWPTAIVCGIIAWAPSALTYRGVAIIIL